MKFMTTSLEGVTLIEPDVFRDGRGFFLETYRADKYRQGGIDVRFVQDNQSRSVKDTLRGMHAQRRHPQAKLVRVLAGTIADIVVDIRRGSRTYLQWLSFELSAENFHQLYVPAGFAHGFCVISECAEIEYKCTDFYDPEDELRIIWNDPSIGIKWPVTAPLLSPKDSAAHTIKELIDQLPAMSGAGG
ncbi:MAG: dTDP-4-dehydrorhamnose 3,5-epimerase [Candidatus Binataceae bacterium]|jgi:dTDP-4-dehydrorhamnose 3,5-epimerase